jgi:diguanylate cyclase (GGDEF)-like protein
MSMTFTGRFLAYLERQNRVFLWLAIIVSVLGLGIIDYETGPVLSISLFYVFPVALATWALGNTEGILIAIVCAALWDGLTPPAGQLLKSPLVYLWNAIAPLGLLLIISMLLAEIRTLLKNESRLSRTDFLTGILNRRALMEAASIELDRLKRTGRPFTLIYMDLDDFKTINDTSGHQAGDVLLAKLATVLKLQLRGIDSVARMGGDEFAAILPETDDQAARKVAPRLQCFLVEEMQRHRWPITFSIGALTCASAPSNTDEMFRLADQLMYDAKRAGKNTICYKVYSG